MIERSRVVVSIASDPSKFDVKFAVETGIAVLLDKPIIAVVRPGTKIPEKLARVVDRFVEYNENNLDQTTEGIANALKELGVGQ
ncbi:hypothetical protein [Neorhodopirellula pilleata]|uniref:Uncharacterized protein n=1 Tax=Neorhodopirellula pilleata TaxID=2714738 RepID=A0A5C5ZWW5_9BACT|nr:hypothetical protein [Neorhodopirellula pilleata]TWT91418.1 hypothetical protein Pla100_52680 [Neorhodopirellula pilleata]TWT91467.1 hypothetical protein Pla100_53170 [Neorhodopirellula pilleata]